MQNKLVSDMVGLRNYIDARRTHLGFLNNKSQLVSVFLITNNTLAIRYRFSEMALSNCVHYNDLFKYWYAFKSCSWHAYEKQIINVVS